MGPAFCHIISGGDWERRNNHAQALIVHLTLYNSIQAPTSLRGVQLVAEGGARHYDFEDLMSNTEWSCEVSTTTLSVAGKLVNDGSKEVRAVFLSELKSRVR